MGVCCAIAGAGLIAMKTKKTIMQSTTIKIRYPIDFMFAFPKHCGAEVRRWALARQAPRLHLLSCSRPARRSPADTRSLKVAFLSRFARRAGFVILGQTFVRCCQNCVSSRSERDRLGFRRFGNHLKVPVMPASHLKALYGAADNARLRAISIAVLTASSRLSV